MDCVEVKRLKREREDEEIIKKEQDGMEITIAALNTMSRLFVEGLVGITNGVVEELFSIFGDIRYLSSEVESRKICRIEFFNPESSQMALEQMNGQAIGDHIIKVSRDEVSIPFREVIEAIVKSSKLCNRIFVAVSDPSLSLTDVHNIMEGKVFIEELEGRKTRCAFFYHESIELAQAAVVLLSTMPAIRVIQALTPFEYYVDDGLAEKKGYLSPVHIDTSNAVPVDFPDLEFVNFDVNLPCLLRNDGHSIKLYVDGGKTNVQPFISGAAFLSRYHFCQLHLHWDLSDQGGEHGIDDQTFAGELHIVFQNSKYESTEEAKTRKNGIAIVAVMVKIQETENVSWRPMLEGCELLKDSSKELSQTWPLEMFLPEKTTRNSFFAYFGSLPSTPFTEAVTWVVLKEPVGISSKQLNLFRTLEGINGESVVSNSSRNSVCKDLTGRAVFTSL